MGRRQFEPRRDRRRRAGVPLTVIVRSSGSLQAEDVRDPDAFDALRRYVFPAVCEGLSARRSLRIWVPGCATGEEVYGRHCSLGMAVPACSSTALMRPHSPLKRRT